MELKKAYKYWHKIYNIFPLLQITIGDVKGRKQYVFWFLYPLNFKGDIFYLDYKSDKYRAFSCHRDESEINSGI